jgi:recombination protein RecR
MEIPSKYLKHAVDQMSSLPGIGKKSALRLVLHLHRRSAEEIEQFATAFVALSKNTKSCQTCGNISDEETCQICRHPSREQSIICVVEDVRDIMAIESTATFKGLYHVLGGVISPMDGIGPSDLNIQTLISRAGTPETQEIIFALSPTMEGDTTCFYLFKKLKEFQLSFTTLSRGVAIGTELQYADEHSLGRSLLYRQPYGLDSK